MKTNRAPLPVEFSLDYIQCADAVFYAELATHCESIIEVPSALCTRYDYFTQQIQTLGSNRRRMEGHVRGFGAVGQGRLVSMFGIC